MKDENAAIMKMAEEKKRKLEEQLEKLKGDSSGLIGEDETRIKQNLDLSTPASFRQRAIESTAKDGVSKLVPTNTAPLLPTTS